MKKECQVIMLPSSRREDSCIFNTTDNKTFRVGNAHGEWKNGNSIKFFDLYIVSNDEIKEGDWCLQLETNTIFQSSTYLIEDSYYMDFNGNKQWANHDPWCVKKIIATTNSSLGITDLRVSPVRNFCEFPKIPQSFLQEYCKNPVDKVMVEYDCDHNQMPNKVIDILKLNSDNTINISSIKTSWSREEVIKLICEAITDANESNNRNVSLNYQTWIKENLK